MSALHRPEPVLRTDARPIDRTTRPAEAVALLQSGAVLRITDHYSTGAEILARLRSVSAPPPGASYATRSAAERALRATMLRLLAPIQDRRLALRGARPIGFPEELYPDQTRFYLPFVEVQELHDAWPRYRTGTHFAVIGQRLHPFFGTYIPTRTEHLELLATWLSQHSGARQHAVDVGTGCGVLALMLCRAGFSEILATDINPNAIESLSRDLDRMSKMPPITLQCGDLMEGSSRAADLIVFNPPWIPGRIDSPIDQALFYSPGLLARFFAQARDRLAPQGRIVVVFSSILQLVTPDAPHPIEAELARGELVLVQRLQRRIKPKPDRSGRRRRTRERVEIWELARAE